MNKELKIPNCFICGKDLIKSDKKINTYNCFVENHHYFGYDEDSKVILFSLNEFFGTMTPENYLFIDLVNLILGICLNEKENIKPIFFYPNNDKIYFWKNFKELKENMEKFVVFQ